MAIHQLIPIPTTRRTLIRAHEHTGVHIRQTRRPLTANRTSIHIHLPAHIIRAVDPRKGILQPGLEDLAVDHRAPGEHGRAGARGALGVADGQVAAGGDGFGDQGLHGVDPGTGGTPAEEHEVFARGVDELVGVGAVGADPGVGGGLVAVGADFGAQARDEGGGGAVGAEDGAFGYVAGWGGVLVWVGAYVVGGKKEVEAGGG